MKTEFDDLLGDLALHRLDIVLSDRPSSSNPNLRLYSHLLASSPLGWYAPAEWTAQARRKFPQSLANVPVLLPSGHTPPFACESTAGFEQQGISPLVVGEFEEQCIAEDLWRCWHGCLPGARAGACRFDRTLWSQTHRALRRRSGALLRHRH